MVDSMDIFKKPKVREKFNGFLMHKDDIVTRIKDDIILDSSSKFLPTYLKRGGDFETWLSRRSIDTHRANSRKLRKRLSLTTSVPKEIVISVHALTLTDNYWIKDYKDSNLKYNDIRYNTDELADVALKGILFEDEIPINTLCPQLTLGGSFEKCWKLYKDNWYLVKKGDIYQNFSEILISHLAKYLRFDCVNYDRWSFQYVVCKNFTDNGYWDYEPMCEFIDDDDDFESTYNLLKALVGYTSKEYLNMIFLDAICLNGDRHNENYGILRDSSNGLYLKMAPIFDNNLALLANKPKSITTGNLTVESDYVPFLKENNYEVPKITKDVLCDIVEHSMKMFPVMLKGNFEYDKNFIVDFIWSKYKLFLD